MLHLDDFSFICSFTVLKCCNSVVKSDILCKETIPSFSANEDPYYAISIFRDKLELSGDL